MIVLNIVLLGVIAYMAYAYMQNRGAGLVLQKATLDILKERYARGEISAEEYRAMTRHL